MQIFAELEFKARNVFPTLATTASPERSNGVVLLAVRQTAPSIASQQTMDCVWQYNVKSLASTYAPNAIRHGSRNGFYSAYL